MEAVATRKWVRNESLARWYRSQMDIGGDVPDELLGRPGIEARLGAMVVTPEAIPATLVSAGACLCGECADCKVALAVAIMENREKLAVSPGDPN